MKDNLDQIYDKYFDTYYAHMLDRRKNDPELTKRFLKELIESLYVAQGNNWEGRSEVKDAEYRAMIAAYEVVLGDWEN
jgi:hypothetical protein